MDVAASLRPRFANEKALPRLLFVTDPLRTPDPVFIASRLPEGSGVIYRAFGAPDALATALTLRAIAAERGLKFLIGADADLARACEADGLHLPERALDEAPGVRDRHPDWILTAAAHSLDPVQRAAAGGCDAAIVSKVFSSRSHSPGDAMGVSGFMALVDAARLPVYALGGVNTATAPQLSGSGIQGLAIVDGLADAVRT